MNGPNSAGQRRAGAQNMGAEIRARIAANRAKRLSIAEAMKREAGVTEHTVWHENNGGLAFIGTGRIASPEGRNMRHLYTVAHECGHIFLHNSGPGFHLPSHVKELEAESYAHQAFREHGMELPLRLSAWGRAYVGAWIAKDRASGIVIDPRAEAYANGTRSPYEPLRKVPPAWTRHEAQPTATVAPASVPAARSAPAVRPETLPRPVAPAVATSKPREPRWRRELRELPLFVGKALYYGVLVSNLALPAIHSWVYPLPHVFYDEYGNIHFLEWLQLMVIGTLLTAILAVMSRTLRAY